MHENLINRIKQIVFAEFQNEATGHDWHHIDRVYSNACYIQSVEGGNKVIIELAALLHDISDHKFNGGKLDEGGKVAYNLLIENGCDETTALQVKEIVDGVSFKGANVEDKMLTLEGKIVQDADRLDALGAIGIARAFAFGGKRNRPIYDSTSSPILHDSFDSYASAKSHTINHFYEKLLLLKNRLHTDTARVIGEERHIYMEKFLDQFYREWEINKTIKN